mgnify:FL=1|jgi:hypothetical protein
MPLFRPINSAESNLYTIRVSIGKDSSKGVFNTGSTAIPTDSIIASNDSSNATTVNHLSSPSSSNLPSGFYIKYVISGANESFELTFGKKYVQQPNITVTPHTAIGSFAGIPNIVKNSITATSNNLTIYFSNTDGSTIPVSTNGTTGLLGFDLEITGPVKLGITTGNSNKGWALNAATVSDPTGLYTALDINLGSSDIVDNSIIISKNLKLLSADNDIKTFSASAALVTADYTNTVWALSGAIAMTELTPQVGMVLIIYNSSSSTATIALTSGANFSFGSNTTITFSGVDNSITLYGTSTTNFIVLSSNGATLS